MKTNNHNSQPNIQNLYPKTEDFKRIVEALRNQIAAKK